MLSSRFPMGRLGLVIWQVMSSESSNDRTWNSGSATKEYGQLFALPFPMKIYGIYGWVASSCAILILCCIPIHWERPVAEKTVSIDANTVASSALPQFDGCLFPSPYIDNGQSGDRRRIQAGRIQHHGLLQDHGAAAHRAADPWGTSGYGISRATGAFADANSSLDHYYIGLIAGAFNEDGEREHRLSADR